jgi:hypothetical protein
MTTASEASRKKAFLEQLRKVPNFRIACERLKIPIPLLYKWKREDAEFWEHATINLEIAKEWSTLSVEGKLLEMAEGGNVPAIKYWLENNTTRYGKSRTGEASKIEGVEIRIRRD